jgi:hypothetical protein
MLYILKFTGEIKGSKYILPREVLAVKDHNNRVNIIDEKRDEKKQAGGRSKSYLG